jgi:hypothetical protein
VLFITRPLRRILSRHSLFAITCTRSRDSAREVATHRHHVATTTPSSLSFWRQRSFPTRPTSNQLSQHARRKPCSSSEYSSDAASSIHAELAATWPRHGVSPSGHHFRATSLHWPALSVRHDSTASGASSTHGDERASAARRAAEWYGQLGRATGGGSNGCRQGQW